MGTWLRLPEHILIAFAPCAAQQAVALFVPDEMQDALSADHADPTDRDQLRRALACVHDAMSNNRRDSIRCAVSAAFYSKWATVAKAQHARIQRSNIALGFAAAAYAHALAEACGEFNETTVADSDAGTAAIEELLKNFTCETTKNGVK